MTVAEVLAGEARSCVEHAKCEAFAPTIPDGSVNLLWLDPPYFRVVDEEWDRAWKTEADFLAWLRGVVREAARVLAPNGALYLFASPQMASRVECITRESLNVLNHLVWVKRQGWHAKADEDAIRGYFPQTERIVFAECARSSDISPLGESIQAARTNAGIGMSKLASMISESGQATGAVSNWESGLRQPTIDNYIAVMRAIGDRRSDDDLRREYDDLRRFFDGDKLTYKTDVWEYETVTPTPQKHPCEKPLPMLRDVVRCSSRPNDVVCEFFGGSFRMAEVALSEGRRYIGCDADEHWATVGIERARAAERGTVAAVPSRKKKVADDRQPSLFGGGK